MNLRHQGVAVLFISHRIEEVFQIADRVTILRDGRWISTSPRAELTPAGAIRRMVGREVQELFRRERRQPGEVRLAVRGLQREGAFHDVTFELRAGEVLGFAGLVGARRTDVGLALFGIAPSDGGEIVLDGKPVTVPNPRDALRLGLPTAPKTGVNWAWSCRCPSPPTFRCHRYPVFSRRPGWCVEDRSEPLRSSSGSVSAFARRRSRLPRRHFPGAISRKSYQQMARDDAEGPHPR